MACLPCFGSAKDFDTVGPTTTTTTTGSGKASSVSSARPNRLNLAPQELYQVDEFPIEIEEAQRWVVVRKPNPKADYRIICIPWAGGNSSIYVGCDLPNTEVVAIELPGRMARTSEKPYERYHPMAAKLAEALEALGYLRSNAKKLIIFGYSFSSLLAYQLTCVLRAAYNYTPYYLVVAGCTTPKDRWSTHMSEDDDDKIIATILEWGTVTPAVAASPEMKTVHVPVIRADHACMDNYTCLEEPPLSIPILCLVGSEDMWYHGGVMKRWKDYTTGTFTMRTIMSHHYFAYSKKAETMAAVEEVVLKGKTESDAIIIPKGTEHEPDSRVKPPVWGAKKSK